MKFGDVGSIESVNAIGVSAWRVNFRPGYWRSSHQAAGIALPSSSSGAASMKAMAAISGGFSMNRRVVRISEKGRPSSSSACAVRARLSLAALLNSI